MLFQKNSSLQHIFNYYIFKMKETGVLDKALRNYDASPPNCNDKWVKLAEFIPKPSGD